MEMHVESKRKRANTNKRWINRIENYIIVVGVIKKKVENKALKRVKTRLVELEVKGEENEEEN